MVGCSSRPGGRPRAWREELPGWSVRRPTGAIPTAARRHRAPAHRRQLSWPALTVSSGAESACPTDPLAPPKPQGVLSSWITADSCKDAHRLRVAASFPIRLTRETTYWVVNWEARQWKVLGQLARPGTFREDMNTTPCPHLCNRSWPWFRPSSFSRSCAGGSLGIVGPPDEKEALSGLFSR